MKLTSVLLILCAFCYKSLCQGIVKHKPAQGIFKVKLNESLIQSVVKTVYNGTDIFVTAEPDNDCKYNDKDLYLHLVVIGTTCKSAFLQLEKMEIASCISNPNYCFLTVDEHAVFVNTITQLNCHDPTEINHSFDWRSKYSQKNTKENVDKNSSTDNLKNVETKNQKTDDDLIDTSHSVPSTTTPKAISDSKREAVNSSKITVGNSKQSLVTTVEDVGVYIVLLGLRDQNGDSITPQEKMHAVFDLTIKMRSPFGFLSADEYPLLTFYMVMCIVYVFYAVSWLVMSACNYQDLLRVQFWIGSVILLGLIEKAVHYAEYLNVNKTGKSELGTEKFAAFVDCLKRTVARMLVIIVSLGFGIVKPRLGPTLHKVIGIGLIYFLVALVERMLAIDVYFHEGSSEALVFMYIPLSIIDSIICYWIFVSLLQTMKTLRLRRNTTKLALYRHFANTIVFCVVVSVLMMGWAFFYHEQGCNKNFVNSWFETACWPMLFSFILLIIMILWRPNANNQRYAYSPMIDGNGSEDEDVEEPMLGGGTTETIKMRGGKKQVRSDVDKTEEDLKWIEENIPQTVADAAIPALLDSDEEIMTTKYEMNKME